LYSLREKGGKRKKKNIFPRSRDCSLGMGSFYDLRRGLGGRRGPGTRETPVHVVLGPDGGSKKARKL